MEVRKNKYLILNHNFEVLVFYSDKNFGKLLIPESLNYGQEEFPFFVRLREILESGGIYYGDASELELFGIKPPKAVHEVVDDVEFEKVFVKKFWFTFGTFTEDMLRSINDLCYEFDFEPHFLGIEELQNISIQGENNSTLMIDRKINKAIGSLKRSLK